MLARVARKKFLNEKRKGEKKLLLLIKKAQWVLSLLQHKPAPGTRDWSALKQGLVTIDLDLSQVLELENERLMEVVQIRHSQLCSTAQIKCILDANNK